MGRTRADDSHYKHEIKIEALKTKSDRFFCCCREINKKIYIFVDKKNLCLVVLTIAEGGNKKGEGSLIFGFPQIPSLWRLPRTTHTRKDRRVTRTTLRVSNR